MEAAVALAQRATDPKFPVWLAYEMPLCLPAPQPEPQKGDDGDEVKPPPEKKPRLSEKEVKKEMEIKKEPEIKRDPPPRR